MPLLFYGNPVVGYCNWPYIPNLFNNDDDDDNVKVSQSNTKCQNLEKKKQV